MAVLYRPALSSFPEHIRQTLKTTKANVSIFWHLQPRMKRLSFFERAVRPDVSPLCTYRCLSSKDTESGTVLQNSVG
ncbi:hypothetical protein N7517_009698 [Penicillium concentricum]|uniref:Uncharacterized protein n=1 Tax=Penicillium concentricum TaxID=293559 RepID=A0A9W9UX17_9EURO|nr:uncharacterized protein N7517_009698 [Penicillium concentricum]KAJ5360507.1 hypothetical protein N7517_009698 [Penicillium concentricum]